MYKRSSKNSVYKCNSNQNKVVGNQYGSLISNIRNDQLLFIDETESNLVSQNFHKIRKSRRFC